MDQQSPLKSKYANRLSRNEKERIDQEMFWLEMTLMKMDNLKSQGAGREHFIESYSQLWDAYWDMINNGSEPKTAKFILMKGLKNDLEKKLAEKKIIEMKGGEEKLTN